MREEKLVKHLEMRMDTLKKKIDSTKNVDVRILLHGAYLETIELLIMVKRGIFLED